MQIFDARIQQQENGTRHRLCHVQRGGIGLRTLGYETIGVRCPAPCGATSPLVATPSVSSNTGVIDRKPCHRIGQYCLPDELHG
ncbi:hypothetical protein [Lysobacter rhizosphaerae]